MAGLERYQNKIYPKTYKIGDIGPSGGYIFITPSTIGNTTGKYFETAPMSYLNTSAYNGNGFTFINTTKTWAQNTPVNYQLTSVSGANGIIIGTGYQNTLDIIAQGNSNVATSAAAYVRSLTIEGKSDWFLPSLNEINELSYFFSNTTPTLPVLLSSGNAGGANCWSSTQASSSTAYVLAFSPLIAPPWVSYVDAKNISNLYVGFPVRSFLPEDSGFFSDKSQRIGNDSIYGTGSDGTVIIASNTSLSRDMYYSNLTINSGSHLNTNGYKVFVKNTLTVNGSVGISAGVSVGTGTLAGTTSTGTSVTNSIGGNAAGVTYTASQVSSDVRSYIENILMGASVSASGTISAFTGGAGGGSGVAGTVTPATAGSGATNGAAGSAGTGATAGSAGSAGSGATAGGAGGAGDLGPHRNVLAPGGNGSAGTPGTNGAAGAAGTPGTNGAAGLAGSNGTNGAAGSTPPAASAGAPARGGGVVLVCAKSIVGSGTIMSLGSDAGLGGNAAVGTGATNGTAGTGATAGGAGANGSGAGAGAAGVAGSAGTAAPGQPVAHHVNSHAHVISGDGTHGAHVQVPSPPLPRGHVGAAHGQHAHGSYTNTHHGATPVHPANHHGGSSPTYGSASTGYAHVAPSGYYHQHGIPHNAGGHLGHDGAVAHGESGSVEFGVNNYHEIDHHHVIGLKSNHTASAHRPRSDHAGHHYNGDHRRAGDQRHVGHTHKAGGAAGTAGAAGTSGTAGSNGVAGTSGTPGTNGAAGTNGTNGSTTAGTHGQSGGGGGIFIITDSTPSGVTTSVSGGTIGGVSASSGNVITVLNA